MTRINLVDPAILTDKHLMAEYRELPRILTAVLKLQEKGSYPPDDIIMPKCYALGQGHVIFFYNKIGWLLDRYARLYEELISRNFNLNDDIYLSVVEQAKTINRIFFMPYKPTPEEVYLSMARLCKRSKIESVLTELSNP